MVMDEAELDLDAAFLGELDGVADEVGDDLAEPHGVGFNHLRHVGGDGGAKLDALGVGARRQKLADVFHDVAHAGFTRLENERARFDLGEIEDLLDEREERHAGLPDRLGIGALVGLELGFEQQPRHAEDAVHRRADFVAHGGEEMRFRAAGFLRLVARAR